MIHLKNEIISVIVVLVNVVLSLMTHSEYAMKQKRCHFSGAPLLNISGENLGNCFASCHEQPLCISISFNVLTNECLGYKVCSTSCYGGIGVGDWRQYCKAGIVTWHIKIYLWLFEYALWESIVTMHIQILTNIF